MVSFLVLVGTKFHVAYGSLSRKYLLCSDGCVLVVPARVSLFLVAVIVSSRFKLVNTKSYASTTVLGLSSLGDSMYLVRGDLFFCLWYVALCPRISILYVRIVCKQEVRKKYRSSKVR